MDLLAAEPGGTLAAQRLVRECPLPCIVTVRSSGEGGGWDGDEADRISFLEAVCTSEHPPKYIDVELASVDRSANLRQKVLLCVAHPGQVREGLPGLILSAHDFLGRPPDLTRRTASMWEDPACAVAKVAWRARSVRDVTEAVELLAVRPKPTSAICMGEFGLMTRVLAPKFGAFLTYAHVDGDAATAPGQPSVRELVGTWNMRKVSRDTALYGVIGWPVAQSRGPEIHNAWFAQHAIDARYVPLPVAPQWESFKATVGEMCACAGLGFRGASVTHPHKEHLVRYVRECGGSLDDASAAIGAANTLVLDAQGGVHAVNTDVPAIAEVMGGLAIGASGWSGSRIAVLGAGGAGRAAAYAMAQAGALVTIAARDPSRASVAAAEIGAAVKASGAARAAPVPLRELALADFDAVVQATPVGMAGGPDAAELPIGDCSALGPHMALLEMVSVPEDTPLVQEARARSARIATGMSLLVAQARRQFQAWTGIMPERSPLHGSAGAPNGASHGARLRVHPAALAIAFVLAILLGLASAPASARDFRRVPLFGAAVDPILFEEVREWCGDGIAIAGPEWPDVCAAHRDYLAAWAAAQGDARSGIDRTFLERLRALLGETSAPVLESWWRARQCAVAEQRGREHGGAVSALRAGTRPGVSLELQSAISSYARISEDSAAALAGLRARAGAGEDVESLRAAERAILVRWLEAEAALEADCTQGGPGGEGVLRALLAGAYPDLTAEWMTRAQLMRGVIDRMPALESQSRDAARSAVDVYTRARWASVQEEIARRRSAATRRPMAMLRSAPVADAASLQGAARAGPSTEPLVSDEDVALLAALAETVGAERAQAIRALAFAELSEPGASLARIVGEDGAIGMMGSLPRQVAAEVGRRGDVAAARSAAYALPDAVSQVGPPLSGIGARTLGARVQDEEDRRAIAAVTDNDRARWRQDVEPVVAELAAARTRAEQAVRSADMTGFDAAAAAYMAIDARCRDAIASHDGQSMAALAALAIRPDGSVPEWVSQVQLARALETRAPAEPLRCASGTEDGTSMSVDLRALAQAIADPDAWDSLDRASRAMVESGLSRVLADSTARHRASLAAAVDAERARIRSDLALREVDALVRQHGSPPAGDPAAFAIQQARQRSAASASDRAKAVDSAAGADAREALAILRALEDSIAQHGDTTSAWQARRFLVSGALAASVPGWSAARSLLGRSERADWRDALDAESSRTAAQLWVASTTLLSQSARDSGAPADASKWRAWRFARGQMEQSAERMIFLAGLPGMKAPVTASPAAASER
jgi:3-dehydroquinate dehydratase/shikimate dehydrogenase